MSFSGKEIERAIRDFENAVTDLLNATFDIYQSRINRLIHMANKDPVINHIIKPFLEVPLELSAIEKGNLASFELLYLPEDMDKQISYVLQKLYYFYENPGSVVGFLINTFNKSQMAENINLLNEQVIGPCMRELVNKLDDLIEDEVKGKDEIILSNLQIIEIGYISTKSGNIAIGKDIKQDYKYHGLKEELVAKFLEAGIELAKIDKVKPEIEKLEKEVKKPKVEKSKLKKILSKFYEIGGQVMIQVIAAIITKPEIISIISEFLKG